MFVGWGLRLASVISVIGTLACRLLFVLSNHLAHHHHHCCDVPFPSFFFRFPPLSSADSLRPSAVVRPHPSLPTLFLPCRSPSGPQAGPPTNLLSPRPPNTARRRTRRWWWSPACWAEPARQSGGVCCCSARLHGPQRLCDTWQSWHAGGAFVGLLLGLLTLSAGFCCFSGCCAAAALVGTMLRACPGMLVWAGRGCVSSTDVHICVQA